MEQTYKIVMDPKHAGKITEVLINDRAFVPKDRMFDIRMEVAFIEKAIEKATRKALRKERTNAIM